MKISKPKSRKKFWVSFFVIDRAYGGSEEGGWYFTCGEPQVPDTVPSYHAQPRAFRSEAQALLYSHKLTVKYLDRLNKDLPSIASVLSVGQWVVYVTEGKPRHFPEARPYYC